jgi:hypothetical protein
LELMSRPIVPDAPQQLEHRSRDRTTRAPRGNASTLLVLSGGHGRRRMRDVVISWIVSLVRE